MHYSDGKNVVGQNNDKHSQHKDYNKHAGHSVDMFKNRFYISLILTIPVLILSPIVQQQLWFSLVFPGDKYVVFLIASIIFFYGGWPFLIGAINEIKNRAIGMMTLISLAICVAYFYSAAIIFGLNGMDFFWELATLIDIMLLGHWIEMKSVMGASTALEKLSDLIPDMAHLIKNQDTINIKTSTLKDGDIILVKPGEKIPTDGFVIDGRSYVNESMLTGEAKPITKSKNAQVIGGSINEDGVLYIKVRGVRNNSYLSKVINLVKEAQASKSKTQMLADKAAFWLTIIAILASLVTFISWIIINGNLSFAIERTATVLVIACPHALGLAVPLVVAISTTLSAQNGLLIRNRTAFENSRKITTIVFDKTGTLTQGTFSVKNILPLSNEFSQKKILSLSAALEKNSEHPIGKAIIKAVKEKKITIPAVNNFKAIKGKGVEGIISGDKVTIASPGYISKLGLKIPVEIEKLEGTVIFLIVSRAEKNILAGAINLTDTIRQESFEAIKILKREGIKAWMLTGDNEQSAKIVSSALGLDGYFSGVLPDKKQEKIKNLQQHQFVAMVGDGINDAPAIAQADVGIAVDSGTDVAVETADIILINSNPQDIASLIVFGKATYYKMIQNLMWATGYNIIAIPLAAGVLASYGILLSPALGAIFMSLSTVIVAINAKLLKINK